jgi:excisionase family DNA binding protein
MVEGRLLKVPEVATMLGVHPMTVRRLARERAIRYYKIPGVGLRFKMEDVQAYIAAGRREARAAGKCQRKAAGGNRLPNFS